MKYVGGTQKGLFTISELVKLGGTVKVTHIDKGQWNDREGQNYTVRVKATAPEGKVWRSNKRKGLLFEFETNSSWLEPEDEEDEDKTEQEIIKGMVANVCY